MNENVISWNFPNWVTVTLMAAVGLAVVAFAAQMFHHGKALAAQGS